MDSIRASGTYDQHKITAMLLWQSIGRDRALGLTIPGQHTRALAWFYFKQRGQLFNRAIKHGIYQQAEQELTKLLKQAQQAETTAERYEYLKLAERMQIWLQKLNTMPY